MKSVKEQAALAFQGLQEIRSVIAKHRENFSLLGCSVSIEGYTRSYGSCRNFTETDISRAAWYTYIEQLSDATEEQRKRLMSQYADRRHHSHYFWEDDAALTAIEAAAGERRQEAKRKVLAWLFKCSVHEGGKYVEKNYSVLPQKIRIHALPCVSASAKNPLRPRETYDTEQMDNLEAMLCWELKGKQLEGPGIGSRIVEIWGTEWCDKSIGDVKTMQFSCEFFQLRAYKSGNVEMTFTPEALRFVNAEEPKDETTLALESLIISKGLSPRSIPRREVQGLLDDALAHNLLEPMARLVNQRFGHVYDVDDYLEMRAYREAKRAESDANCEQESAPEVAAEVGSTLPEAVAEETPMSGSDLEIKAEVSPELNTEEAVSVAAMASGSVPETAADIGPSGITQDTTPVHVAPDYADLLQAFLQSLPALPVLNRSTLGPKVAGIIESSRTLLDSLNAKGGLDLAAAGSIIRDALGLRFEIESRRTPSNSQAIDMALLECDAVESLGRAVEELTSIAPALVTESRNDDPQPDETVRVHYSAAEGALVHGVKTEDKEVHRILHTFGFRWSSRIGDKGAWYKSGTRRRSLNNRLCLLLVELTEALTDLGRMTVLDTEESPKKAA